MWFFLVVVNCFLLFRYELGVFDYFRFWNFFDKNIIIMDFNIKDFFLKIFDFFIIFLIIGIVFI